MSTLFAPRNKSKSLQKTDQQKEKKNPRAAPTEHKIIPTADSETPESLQTFENLGICSWLQGRCHALGIRRPTPVQTSCIPQILNGKDVIGCAPTGSGKTAAFALPIIYRLSEDPYGPFALVLTPTRELAYQIAEQFQAFGSSFSIRACVIVGGIDMLKQSLELQNRPHIIIATPGRLRSHLIQATPPDLSLARFVVLDEADRLLGDSFASDLRVILKCCSNPLRQTLLFSATMNEDVCDMESSIEARRSAKPFRFDATPTATTVETLTQKYVFLPAQVKSCYLVHILEKFGATQFDRFREDTEEENFELKRIRSRKNSDDDDDDDDDDDKTTKECRLMIIFISTCKMCQTLGELLNQMNVKCVMLHSIMSQTRRLASLGKFKSGTAKIMLCTDVASRGLDIPQVDLVVNFDMPRAATDYIHRVGRTARAGKEGLAISLVSQYDIELLQNIEQAVGRKMEELKVNESDVLKRLQDVSTATRMAKMKLVEYGFDDRAQIVRNRRRKRKQIGEVVENQPLHK